MPTTKTPKKKAARKATKPSRTTILENSVKHIHKRLDIHRDQIAAIEKHLDILTRTSHVQAKEIVDLKLQGKWVPKKGDWVAMSDDYPKTAHPWEEKVRQVGSCLGDRVLFGDEFGFYPLNCIRPATQAEIDAHLESSAYGERDGLAENQACEADKDQQMELYRMCVAAAMPAAGLGVYDKNFPCVMWDGGCMQSVVDLRGNGTHCEYLPFPVFKKLLIKTIEKLRAAREEEEAKKPIEPGTKVKHKDGREGIWLSKRITQDTSHIEIHWLALQRAPMATGWDWETEQVYRSEFTVLNN